MSWFKRKVTCRFWFFIQAWTVLFRFFDEGISFSSGLFSLRNKTGKAHQSCNHDERLRGLNVRCISHTNVLIIKNPPKHWRIFGADWKRTYTCTLTWRCCRDAGKSSSNICISSGFSVCHFGCLSLSINNARTPSIMSPCSNQISCKSRSNCMHCSKDSPRPTCWSFRLICLANKERCCKFAKIFSA